jgi:uncharacterized membrane protein YsdA (DUF1294 family)
VKPADTIALTWCIVASTVTFLVFGFDKWRAKGPRSRVPEFTLASLAAIGGWPGGLLGMILFRHKTAKWTFKLKFAVALVPFAAEVWLWRHWR